MKAKYNNDNCQNYGGVGREDEFVVRHNNKKRRYTLYELDVLELSFHYYREWKKAYRKIHGLKIKHKKITSLKFEYRKTTRPVYQDSFVS